MTDPDVLLRKILKKLSRSPRDGDAWRNLYTLMWPSMVTEMYYAFGGDEMKAPDATQHVLLSLSRTSQPPLLKDPRAFLTYVGSEVVQVSREVRLHGVVPRIKKEDERAEVLEMLREMREAPDKASQQLRAEDRDVLERYYIKRLTYKELGEHYRVTEDDAEQLVARARLHLRLVTSRVADNLPIPGDLE